METEYSAGVDPLVANLNKFLGVLDTFDWGEYAEMEEAMAELKNQLSLFKDHLELNGDGQNVSVENSLREFVSTEMEELTSLINKLNMHQQSLDALKTKSITRSDRRP